MIRQFATRLLIGFCFATAPGCEEPQAPLGEETDSSGASSGGTSENETPVFAAMVGSPECSGAQSLELIATLVGCVGFGPCTLPNPRPTFPSASLDCATIGEHESLTIAIDRKGLYQVELVATLEDATQLRNCYGTEEGARTSVDQSMLDARPTISLTPLGMPCPSTD